MTLFKHEMRQGRRALLIWSVATGGMMMICLLMYPEMEAQMEVINVMFASMGLFTKAFGMDQINFGTLMGFYGVEGGNMLGILGAFYAAMLGARMLAKEEDGHTAEYLLTHPLSRQSAVSQKLLALIAQVLLFNAVYVAFALLAFVMIGETPEWGAFWLFQGAQLFMQLEIACVCFGLSAFLRRGGTGMGIGLAAVLYFANILCNLSDSASFLRYLTPYAYAEPSRVLSQGAAEGGLMALGLGYAALGVIAAYVKYGRKDIAA